MFWSFSSHTVTVQVQLLSRLLFSWSNTWARLQRHGIFRQTSSIPEAPAGAAPSSPVRSSAGTALPDTSTCSPSADLGSPTEVCVTPAVMYLSRLRQLCLPEYKHAAHNQDILSIVEPNERIGGSFWSRHVNIKVREDSILDLQKNQFSFAHITVTFSFIFLVLNSVGWKLKPEAQQVPHTAGYWLLIKINFFVCVLLSCLLCWALWIIKGQTILV